MDQVKIGKFIAERRRSIGLTQAQLAEKLYITDRAVSKWENGKSMPDTSIMLDLCKLLKISVNDLLSGEIVDMENYNEKSENNLLEMAKQKEKADKQLLTLEIVFGVISSAVFFALIILASFADIDSWLRIVLIITGFVPFVVFIPFAIKIEQTAGYYECAHCHHKYVPSYSSVLWAMHFGRTRYMKCPECNKKSWHKKSISKDN